MYTLLYIKFMTNLIPISDVRAKLPDLVDKVNKKLDRVTITVNGQPKAVLLSAEELESIEETLEILSNHKLMKDLKKAEKEIEDGQYITLEELEKELKLDV